MRKITSSMHPGLPLGKDRLHARPTVLATALLALLGAHGALAQLPGDLPWPGSPVGGRTVIVQPGVAAFTCGTTTNVIDPAERHTFGLMNVDGAVPPSGRVDQTASVPVYHHPSWLIGDIGNVFGVAINERTGDILVSASSNYAAGFLNNPAILGYGSIGGGTDDLSAAGTVYRIDGVTGDPSVFAVLPQQSATFTHINCEGPDSQMRTTGVGLGNIHYDAAHDQYFVSNIEDGRIYRLGADGAILDSYDPGLLDDGASGITSLNDLVYGLAVEPGGGRLFFGGVSTTGQVPLRSIDLTATGGFVGSVDNTTLPAGATWDNHVGTETLHTNLTAETVIAMPVHHLADLSFMPDARLLAGVRIGCNGNWASSYNHSGESDVISPDGSGTYNASIVELDISVSGFLGSEDAYGGVAHYEHADGAVDLVVTSSDILGEPGPHGLAIFDSLDAAVSPVSPLAAVSYGVVDLGDPKGVGGSVDVFSAAFTLPLTEIPTLGVWGLLLLILGLGAAATRLLLARS